MKKRQRERDKEINREREWRRREWGRMKLRFRVI